MLSKGTIIRWTGWLAVVLMATTLSSCLYFNTWWNAKKAYNQGERYRLARFHKNPDDTVRVSKDETDLYRRAIAKASKVIETYPKDTTWQDRSLLLIGMAQERLGEYENASRKYGELVEAFPWSPHYEEAVEGKIECLLALGRPSEAEEWMRRLDSSKAAGGPAGVLWLKARVALGKQDTAMACEYLTQLVALRRVKPESRQGEAAYLLGSLSWAVEDWEAARAAYLHRTIATQPRLTRFRARLYAALSLDRLGRTDEARRALDSLTLEKQYAREWPYAYLEAGRMLLSHQLYGDALAQFARLEKCIEPPEAVAEGLLIAGKDAQHRRLDYPEARRLYELSAKVGPGTVFGQEARQYADAITDLLELRRRKTTDSTVDGWTFDLAELHLLRLGDYDSARAAYQSIADRPGASYETRARAGYAVAWIDDTLDSTHSGKAWREVISKYPGTEYAKQAQKNIGVPVTVHTHADSSEDAYQKAEALWDTTDSAAAKPVEADSAFHRIARDWKGTEAGKRALYASAWIEDHLLSDSAAAVASYRRVVDSLPGTPWAEDAGAVLEQTKNPGSLEFQKRRTDAEDGSILLEEDEGAEAMDPNNPHGFGPTAPSSPTLKSPDEPDAIPPTPDSGYLSPDDFQ